jgi:agmatinase
MEQRKSTFFNLNPGFEDADAVLVPVPYGRTASYVKGSENGPAAILEASDQLEEYDVELGFNISEKLGIFTHDDLKVAEKSPEGMVKEVEAVVQELVGKGKKPVVLGGEHSITAGVVAGLGDRTISVLQIDAHADLRDSYQGSKHNHACVMRRVRELSGNVVQVGIRSMSEEEAQYIKENGLESKMFYAHEFSKDKIEQIIAELGDKVYVTVDVDGFDPSVMPGTGTPHPGGLVWDDVTSLMKAVGEKFPKRRRLWASISWRCFLCLLCR